MARQRGTLVTEFTPKSGKQVTKEKFAVDSVSGNTLELTVTGEKTDHLTLTVAKDTLVMKDSDGMELAFNRAK